MTNMDQPPTPQPMMIAEWDRLTFWQKHYLYITVLLMTGGRVAKAIAVIGTALIIAALVYIASSNWVVALAVGVFLGWVISELIRSPKK